MPLKFPPLLLLALLLMTAQLSCVRSGNNQPADASPTPSQQAVIDEIFERYQQALGGHEATKAITSLKMKGTWELGGLSGTIQAWQKEPQKRLTVVEFPRIGFLKKGVDGETRWVQSPAGTFTDNSPQEIAELERDAEVFSVGRIRRLYESMKVETNARLNKRDMRVIEGKPVKGPAEKLFFDAENGLLVRWDMARRVPNRGIVFAKVHLEDYREVGGVKMPFYIRYAFEQFTFLVKVDEIQHNVAIDDAIFKKP